jgi:dephospho-CoA kinase
VKLFGLTGGIATGKSTVTAMLQDLGAPVIDADLVAREVVEPGQPALAEIAARFPGVVKDGALDRKALGERIFGKEDERKALNAITHPRIQARVMEKSVELANSGAPLAVYDAALLIENRLHEAMEGVILVVADPRTQRERLMQRNNLSAAEAEARIASQMPLDEKKKFATWIIDNSGSREATRAQVDEVWKKLQQSLKV